MKNKQKFTKEWVELTLCNMLDDSLVLLRSGKSQMDIMANIKRYADEIYKAQRK